MNSKQSSKHNPSVLEVKNLSWHPKSSSHEILSDICCRLEKGYFYGVIGPNGSGKTSLIRHILRLLPVSDGHIAFDKNDIRSYRRKELARTCAYVAQKSNDMFSFSVYDTVAMGVYPWRKMFQDTDESNRLAIDNAFDVTHTNNLKEKAFHVLSGGEAQRVMIARAIAQKAPWLFLDEPVSHLDIAYQMDILKMLMQMRDDQEKTIVCVLHDINLAYQFCDRIILMKEGKIVGYGDKINMLTPKNLEKVYGISFEVLDVPNNDGRFFAPIV